MTDDDWPSLESVAKIARSVLYEGYVLWPYRRSALKNQRRWTFGGVFPSDYSRAGHSDDASTMITECVIESNGAPRLLVTVRFLQVGERRVARMEAGRLVFVDTLTVGGREQSSWQEAIAREVTVGPIAVCGEPVVRAAPIVIQAGGHDEPLNDENGRTVGMVLRSWEAIVGSVVTRVDPLRPGVWRVGVEIVNRSGWNGEDRERVLAHTLVSTHTVLRVLDARFVSLLDPPAGLAEDAGRCRNVGTFPVLAGNRVRCDIMLSSPIILYDFPEIAESSPGDLFDGGEIDQLLILNVLALTDEEQRAMREADPQTRAILERCQRLTPNEILRLHGVTRELKASEIGR